VQKANTPRIGAPTIADRPVLPRGGARDATRAWARKLQTAVAKPFPLLTGVEPAMNKKALLACLTAFVAAVPAVSYADVAFNVGAFSDYRYRGISQSRLKPALQGGVDYSNGPFYAGAWASTIKWIEDAGTIFATDLGGTKLELDLYGGVKGEITKELTYDVGVLAYVYPGNKTGNISPTLSNANTTEIYGALTYGPATLKYSHALTNTFANPDSKGSFYLDLSAGFDVGGGLMVTPHLGYQKIKGTYESVATYSDYSLTVSKDFSGVVVSGAIVGTDADKTWYITPAGKFLGKTTLVLGVKYNF
jgi:uncharacterized protein (TIGR02001 family)